MSVTAESPRSAITLAKWRIRALTVRDRPTESFVKEPNVIDLGEVEVEVYSATQLTSVDSGEVGHAKPEEHHVCCCRVRIIGWSGMMEGSVTVPHTFPSTVYVSDVGVQMTPQVCHCLLYTSDAADDLLCVDLGGRRII